MARRKDILGFVETHLKSLADLYYETDPGLGEKSQTNKHFRAMHAMRGIWNIQGQLAIWAQAHMTGYAVVAENPGLAEFLEKKTGKILTDDSHIFEHIGLLYTYNPPNPDDLALDKAENLLNEFAREREEEQGLSEGEFQFLNPSAMRKLIFELLEGNSADNSYWRWPLQHSLRALNEGEADELVKPRAGKRQGAPSSLNRWKLEALKQVWFRVGKGMKKYRALEEIGGGIGQSSETLKDWEKHLKADSDYFNELHCSELAGKYESELDRAPGEHRKFALTDNTYHRGTSDLVTAFFMLKDIRSSTLDIIRYKISQFRGKSGG